MGDSFTASSFERETSEVPAVPNYWAEKGKKLIDEDYARLNGVEDICRELGISSSRVRDVFRTAFGVSPKEYLVRVKIEAAKTILRQDRGTITRIAAMVGFRERSVFENAFRRIVGVTPSAYRKSIIDRRF